MLITRAPVRISFAGGGTDFASYYERYGGLVVTTTIDKYFYVFANLIDADSVQISSSDYRAFFRAQPNEPLWDDDMSVPRAFLREFSIDAGISLFLASEIPPGTGLGSSSTVSVALAKALGTLRGLNHSKAELAEIASRIEIEELGMPIGRQDQYAAAFGGLSVVRFGPDGIDVERLELPVDVVQELEKRALLFFTGCSRNAASILSEQQTSTQRGDRGVLDNLHRIKELALEAVELMRAGDVDALGPLLDRSWQEKREIATAVTNADIDRWYRLAKDCGATGGKILGAGGGGFLLAFTPEEAHSAVTAALEAEGLVRIDYSFESGGAVVLMNALPGPPPAGSLSASTGAPA